MRIKKNEPDLIDKFILVHPDLFSEMIADNFECIEISDLRDPKLEYLDAEGDHWNKSEFTATLWMNINTGWFLLFVSHQAKLYSCRSIFEAASIMKDLEAAEALKESKSPYKKTVLN